MTTDTGDTTGPGSSDTPSESPDSAAGLDPELAEEAEQTARELIAGGYLTEDEAAEALTEIYAESDEESSTVRIQAERIVAPLWAERLAEQATWPARTDIDALEAAFAALERRNIVARDNFACCARCGHGEIRAEAGPDSVGYVFFHQQSTTRAVVEGQLWLYFGACRKRADEGERDGEGKGAKASASTSAEDPATAIGEVIVEEIGRAGLPVEWNGDADTAILVAPIEWRRRLPV